MRLGEMDTSTANKVLSFLDGKMLRDVTNELIEKPVLSPEEVVMIRRLAFCTLLFCNFQRIGTIKNMTVSEFKSRTIGPEYDIVYVFCHKTAERHGSAKVVVEKKHCKADPEVSRVSRAWIYSLDWE